ncbi:MAG: putative zinc-binding protein [Candidatus Bathyarchaeota archaeon]|nr:putative zinc-binding protein [Candidatus Bathyarchaeota archaeon]
MKIKPKIGVVSCSGECCGLGTLSRVATRLALEESDETVTICLPLFLAGETEEHSFAKDHPTIAVDGCGKRCAYKAIAKYSKEPAAGIDVEALLKEWGVAPPEDRRTLDGDGLKAARRIAELLAVKIDKIQGAA